MAAGRPIKVRNTKSLNRDIESLSRLRVALSLNQEHDKKERDKCTKLIDSLIEALGPMAAKEQ